MKLSNLLQKLAAFEPNGLPFISLYLNAEANEHGREDYKIWLKKELSEQGKQYEEHSVDNESFEKTVEKINDYIANEADAAANGIAIFSSSGPEDFFEAVQLIVPFPENCLYVNDRPHIFPLARAIDQNPKYAVLWADTNKASIYVFGGENRIRTDNQTDEVVEEIQNTVTNRTMAGGWSQSRFQRHVENFHLQHAKEVVDELEEIMSKRDIDYLILCGDETRIMPVLRPQLSKELEDKVIATLNISQYESVDEIHEKTREVMGTENAVSDQKQVERVFDAAKAAAKLGTLGLEDTLRALSNGQVQELVISDDFDLIEYDPNMVKRILEDYAPGEDQSSTDTLPIVNEAGQIADELIVRAINSGAKIIFIEDESLLKDVGGVGAVLRYNMNATANG